MLELLGLTRSYGEKVALDNISFSVAPGQMCGFIGPNGAGKTTAMRIVLGVLAPDRGEVRWKGRPADLEVRRRFGYMPEERGLYPKMRVRDQLVHFARLHGLDATAADHAAEEWLDRLGLTHHAADPVEDLSLGNQQRAQLGVALVHDPELLVLDEPFSGLDPVGVDVLSGVLGELAERGVSVVFSSHQLELVERLCETVAIIKAGRLVAEGSVDELREAGRSGQRVRVVVDADEASWLAGLAGRVTRVEDTERHGRGGVLIDLADSTSADEVLDAVRRAGSVSYFAIERPTLAELFRAVVAEPIADSAVEAVAA